MVRRATPKIISLPNGRIFTALYGRARRVDLPENVNLKRKYKMRATTKNKKRRWGVEEELVQRLVKY